MIAWTKGNTGLYGNIWYFVVDTILHEKYSTSNEIPGMEIRPTWKNTRISVSYIKSMRQTVLERVCGMSQKFNSIFRINACFVMLKHSRRISKQRASHAYMWGANIFAYCKPNESNEFSARDLTRTLDIHIQHGTIRYSTDGNTNVMREDRRMKKHERIYIQDECFLSPSSPLSIAACWQCTNVMPSLMR